jgi:hypothetical protein
MLDRRVRHSWSAFALFVAVAITVLGGLARPDITYACSCMVSPDPQTAMAESAAVFAGRVVEVVPGDPVRYTFEVTRLWKGVASATVQLFSAQSSASCGYEFAQGQEYLVFANLGERGLETSLCSRTAPLADAAADLAALGPEAPPAEPVDTAVPEPDTAAPQPAGGTSGAMIGGSVLALAALGTLAVWWRRRARAA